MKRKHMIVLLFVTVVLLLLVSVAMAANGYDLSWWTVDGGGGTSSVGGSYNLSGTIGQPDAGLVLNGSGYQLTGGFWVGEVGGAAEKIIYLPLVRR